MPQCPAASKDQGQTGILPDDPAFAWLKQGARKYHARFLEERLDELAREADAFGLSREDTVRAIALWAARRFYAEGGYPRAKAAMLDALEAILLTDARSQPD
jgi:hypothetical protein